MPMSPKVRKLYIIVIYNVITTALVTGVNPVKLYIIVIYNVITTALVTGVNPVKLYIIVIYNVITTKPIGKNGSTNCI